MGCGKTTVGRVLAHAWAVPLVDLDERIERLFAATVPELLAARGEPGFRDAEARALASLLAEPGFSLRGVVVALGGGAGLDPAGRLAMDRAGTRIYLEVSEDELVRRLRPEIEADPGARPLLQGGSLRGRVAELLVARGALYRAGALCIDAQGDPGAVAARITAALAEPAEAAREPAGAVPEAEPASERLPVATQADPAVAAAVGSEAI
jgi:shikimate kinase